MATRSTIERIARQIDRLAAKHEATTHVPLYGNETEAEALEAYGQAVLSNVVFNRTRPGDRREDGERSGMDLLYRLGPSDVRRLLSQIDGKTRGIVTSAT